MNIGLIGLTFGYKRTCNNRGCEALSISFLEVLNEIAMRNSRQINVFLLVPISIKKVLDVIKGNKHVRKCYLIDKNYSNLSLDVLPYWVFKGNPKLLRTTKKCDVIVDFTSGDSFTDIYGDGRYYLLTKAKKQVMAMGIPLVLGSQTIGPFKKERIKKDASDVISRCKEVFVRDQLSYDYVKKICGREAKKTTDVAFFLPYKKKIRKDYEKTIIGFNPSGLLWHGGYNRSNQFELKFDYQKYCSSVLEKISNNEKYELVLIPHAYSSDMESVDNDLIAVLELKKRFPKCVAVTEKLNSMEIKSQINQCDVFIGARMHATIAAFSSGVATIPVAYSRKFKGIYDEYEYPYIIDASKDTLNEAVDKTLQYIENLGEIKTVIEKTREKVSTEKERIIQSYSDLLASIFKW